MRRTRDIVIATAVVAVCAWGVIAQLDDEGAAADDAVPAFIAPLELGEVLDADVVLRDLQAPPRPRSVLGELGRGATVLYTWSAACPCITDLEPRLRRVHARFGAAQRVRWIALAGEPGEDLERLRAKRDELQPFYPVLRDPDQLVCRRLGLRHAGQVAVLDGEGRLRYRGAIDHHWTEGEAEFLETALAAVVAGRAPSPPEEPRRYGCEFSLPASCLAEEPSDPTEP